MRLGVLARNRWMVAVRGVLAIVFGLTVILWRDITLPVVVVVFGVYALLDGLWAIVSALVMAWPQGRHRDLDVWSVGAEGLLGVAVGALAIGWPFVSGEFVSVLALWAAATGVLEIVTATLLPRETSAHWLIGTAGVLSIFLAVLVFMVPRADSPRVVQFIAGYAVGFGMLLSSAAMQFRAPGTSRRVTPRRA